MLYAKKPVESIKNLLKGAKMDIDDDIILFQNNQVFELYKISDKNDFVQSNFWGTWNSKNGLSPSQVPKWYRRGNLKVIFVDIFS